MRFMIIVKATKDSEAGVMPHEQILGEMAKYHEELQQAGVLLDAAFCSRSFGPMPKLAPLLAQHFTVFMYDRRGRGDSGDTAPYAVEREIDDLDAVIREAGGSAFVYAMSSGAALALEAGASRLDITKLALYEPPFMVGSPAHVPPVEHHARLRARTAQGRRR